MKTVQLIWNRIWFAEIHRICQKAIAVPKRTNLQRHREQLHLEFKVVYPPDSDLRRKKLRTLLVGFQFKPSNPFSAVWLKAMTT